MQLIIHKWSTIGRPLISAGRRKSEDVNVEFSLLARHRKSPVTIHGSPYEMEHYFKSFLRDGVNYLWNDPTGNSRSLRGDGDIAQINHCILAHRFSSKPIHQALSKIVVPEKFAPTAYIADDCDRQETL